MRPEDKQTLPHLVMRVILAIPILGYAVRCFRDERDGELLVLIGTLAMAGVLAVLLFGLPAFVTILYTLLILVAAFVIATTLGGA